MANKKNLSLASRGLRYKLKISFYLMSILPLLVCIYLVSNYILPHVGLKLDIAASIAISILIAIIGFFLIKEVFDRILSVSIDAKLIAAGDITHTVTAKEEDEVGDLGDALNQLTQRIRGNMDELKNYSEKTTEINLEIQKRVLVLSSLLQISSLISQGAKLEDILKITVEKSRLLANSDAAYLLLREEGQEPFSIKIADGINATYLLKIRIEPQEVLFSKIAKNTKPFILDKTNMLPENLSVAFYDKFKLKNTLAIPVFLRGRIVALLGIGNTKDPFSYRKDDLELLDIFAKQVAIAIENDLLTNKARELAIRDELTGLYNEKFILNRLEEEIKRAVLYQRPCSFLVFNIDDLGLYRQINGDLAAEETIKKIGKTIESNVTAVDRVARLSGDSFAVILPEKNKKQANTIAEALKQRVEVFGIAGGKGYPHNFVTVSGGVGENPIDGVTADDLIKKATSALSEAKSKGKNTVVS